MQDLPLIRRRLAELLADRLGIPVYAYPPASPRPPCVTVHADPGVYIEPHQAMVRGLAAIHLVLTVVVGAVDDQTAHEQLDLLLGPIVDVLEPAGGSQTLSGLVSDCAVDRIAGVTAHEIGTVRHLACAVDVTVRLPLEL